MDTIRLILEGSCKGTKPVNYGIEELTNEEWYSPLLYLILEKKCRAAEELVKKWLNAEFLLENLEKLDKLGFQYVETLSTYVSDPFTEEVDGIKIPLFRWIGAEFVIDAPVDVVNEWISKDGAGKLILDDDALSEWLEENDCKLQDGCIYRVGSIWYDLEGFGENRCNINKSKLEQAVNSHFRGHPLIEDSALVTLDKLSGKQLLAKLKEMEDASKDDIVRACGYVSLDKKGKEKLDYSSFFEALMEAKRVFA